MPNHLQSIDLDTNSSPNETEVRASRTAVRTCLTVKQYLSGVQLQEEFKSNHSRWIGPLKSGRA